MGVSVLGSAHECGSRRGVIVGATAVGLLLVAVVAGCAAASGVPQPDPTSSAEAHDAFQSTLDATQNLAGGTWQSRDDPVARSCGAEGEQFPALRIGSPPENISSAVDGVVAAWGEWGYMVTSSVVHSELGDVAEVQAHGQRNEYLILRVSAQAMTLQGESECHLPS